MNKVKVSCVSYLNSRPFIYGLENSPIRGEIDLQLDIPSICASKVQEGIVDIGLVPVTILKNLEFHHIISEYCIGADGEVGSVLLVSEVPLHQIRNILLDYQSRTSIVLVKILAEKYWKVNVQFHDASKNYESLISGNTAGVIIGDRTFAIRDKFRFVYDLAHEWKLFTNLPFVFACWVANKNLDRTFLVRFNEALRFGLMNSEMAITGFKKENGFSLNIRDYLENKISYAFDGRKKFALELFQAYAVELEKNEVVRMP